MREICTSGSMSGEWKRSMAELVRHRQTKEPETDRLRLNHRATPRLYLHGRGGRVTGHHPSPGASKGMRAATHNTTRRPPLACRAKMIGVVLVRRARR